MHPNYEHRARCNAFYYDQAEKGLLSCARCPAGANCDAPGTVLSKIEAKPGNFGLIMTTTLIGFINVSVCVSGWWRVNSSLTYQACVRPAHCRGGEKDVQCADNRHGPLCTLCNVRAR